MKTELLEKLLEMILLSGNNENETKQEIKKEKGRYIVIGNRGNIVVGDLTIIGSTGYMKNASVIRRWGTDKGLGQLAIEGKQTNTVLDYCDEFEFEVSTTCGMIKVTSDL